MAEGRPSKLTPDCKKRLLQALAAGNYYEPACAYAGIDYSTFRRWMLRGEKESKGEFCEFCEVVQRAIAQSEIASVAKIKKAEEDDWRAAAWLLERRFSDRWASTQKVKIEVEKELEKTLAALEGKMPPDIYAQLLEALAALGEADES